MIITRFESWWVERGKCLFDERRQGGAKMGWDVIVIKLTTDTGVEGIATCMAARSGAVSESYLQESIAPVVLGRDPHDREAIFQELWVIDRHEAFFPVFPPGPVDVALWDICAKEAGLPLYKYIGAYRSSLPVYASSNFLSSVQDYVDEALYYKSRGIKGYKAHPAGPAEFDMKVHAAVREAVGEDFVLMTDPVGDYTLDEAIRVGRQLEKLDYKWFEEPFRDFELYKYTEHPGYPHRRNRNHTRLSLGRGPGHCPEGCRYCPGRRKLEGRHHRNIENRTYGRRFWPELRNPYNYHELYGYGQPSRQLCD